MSAKCRVRSAESASQPSQKSPIRIITYLRTSSCPEGRVIEDRVLKPITPAERKQGVKDELTEWYRTYGSLRPVRRNPDRHRERVRRQPREGLRGFGARWCEGVKV